MRGRGGTRIPERAALEPAVDRREHAETNLDMSIDDQAAIELAVDRREQGSRIPGPLICEDMGPRERSRKVSGRGHSHGVVKVQNRCWPARERSLGPDSPPQRSHSDDHSSQRR